MKLLRRIALFPLLRKDLTEIAQRRRTYVVRVLYALLLFGCFMLFFGAELSRSQRQVASVLGSGRQVFEFLLVAQFTGIFAFLPAMMSGVLTYEKERRSMALLLLTDLRPAEILIEKYLGRLVPMFAFLLLGLPLLAVAYAYGGVPTNLLWASVYMLFVACVQVGALALVCSAFCTSGAQAFIASYVLCFLLYVGPVLAAALLDALGIVRFVDEDVVFAMVPPYVLFDAYYSGVGSVVGRSVPALLSTGLFLLMARVFVVRRAFAVPGQLLRRTFGRLDRFWHKANRLTGGIVLVRDRDTLPDERPITWREVKTRSLARFSNLFRILCLVELPVLVIVALCVLAWKGQGDDVGGLSALLFVLWPIAALALAVVAGNAFPSERVNQTLDVLLTTPISGADIVRQKVRALRRFMFVLAAPLATIYVAEGLLEQGHGNSWPLAFPVASALSILVYFPAIAWISVWMGMRRRSRVGATVGPVILFSLWCVLPVFIMAVLEGMFSWRLDRPPWSFLFLASPACMVIFSEFGDLLDDISGKAPVLAITLNYSFYAAVAVFFRALCLRNADRCLGRVPKSGKEESHVPD
jgi:ABC-type transport system involved in multi-copper enzyme maturation permease subunit